MKKIILLLVLVQILTGCSSRDSIHGKIEGIANQEYKVYLIQPQKLQELASSFLGTVIDSAVIRSDGSFAFKNLPKTSKPLLLEVVLQPAGKSPNQLENVDPTNSNYMVVIWQQDEHLFISASAKSFQQSFSLENPSEANKALLELRDIKLKAYKEFIQNKHWNVEEGAQLLDKEKALLKYQSQLMAFAEETNQFLPAMVALRWVSPANDYERIPEFLFNQCEKWKTSEPNNPWAEQLCNQSKVSNLPLLTGASFPEAELPVLSGETISIYESLGTKLTIIDLWASWCAPCRTENREVLVPLWKEYHKKGLQIIGYGLESDKIAWESAVNKDGAQLWPQASHLQGDDTPFLKTLRIQTIPANFILDASGKVVAKNLHGKDLIQFVKDYIKG